MRDPKLAHILVKYSILIIISLYRGVARILARGALSGAKPPVWGCGGVGVWGCGGEAPKGGLGAGAPRRQGSGGTAPGKIFAFQGHFRIGNHL